MDEISLQSHKCTLDNNNSIVICNKCNAYLTIEHISNHTCDWYTMPAKESMIICSICDEYLHIDEISMHECYKHVYNNGHTKTQLILKCPYCQQMIDHTPPLMTVKCTCNDHPCITPDTKLCNCLNNTGICYHCHTHFNIDRIIEHNCYKHINASEWTLTCSICKILYKYQDHPYVKEKSLVLKCITCGDLVNHNVMKCKCSDATKFRTLKCIKCNAYVSINHIMDHLCVKRLGKHMQCLGCRVELYRDERHYCNSDNGNSHYPIKCQICSSCMHIDLASDHQCISNDNGFVRVYSSNYTMPTGSNEVAPTGSNEVAPTGSNEVTPKASDDQFDLDTKEALEASLADDDHSVADIQQIEMQQYYESLLIGKQLGKHNEVIP